MAITPGVGFELDPLNPNRVRKIGEQTTPDLGSISSANLAGQPASNFVQPNQVPVYPVAGLNPPLQMTEGERRAESGFNDLQELNKLLIGESAFRGEQETVQDVAGKTQAVNDLSSRLKTLQNEALAIPLQLQQEATGRGITAGGLRPIETAALRNNAIQALSTNSLLEAARGNLTTALSLADRAVTQKYDPIREAINATRTNLELIMNSPSYTLQQKNRAQAQLDIQNERARLIEKQAEDEKAVRNIALTAQKYGASADVVDKILNATSYNDAQVLAGTYLQDPMARQELKNAQLEYKVKEAELATKNYQLYLLQHPKEENAKLKDSDKVGEGLNGKITLIDGIKNSSALDSTVGANVFTRGSGSLLGTLGRTLGGAATGAVGGALVGLPFAGVGAIPGAIIGAGTGAVVGAGTNIGSSIDSVTGSRQQFLASVEQLVDKEFLDALVNVKAQGATFGALTEREGEALRTAATKIARWRVYQDGDKNKDVIGYNIDQKSFLDEVKIIEDLTKKAYEKATGNAWSADGFSPDEQDFWNSLEQTETQFNPSF